MNELNKGVTPTTKASVVTESERAEWIRLWNEYGRSIVTAVLIAAVVWGAFLAWRWNRQRGHAEASMALAAARLPEQLEEVIRRFGATPSGPPALLELAATRYHQGAYAVALSLYEEFLKKYPTHEMAAAAEIGRLHALEELNRAADALSGYEAFVRLHADHFLAPLAVFGRSRCLLRLDRAVEARAVYEDFLTTQPDEPWRSQAEAALATLERTRRPAELPASTP